MQISKNSGIPIYQQIANELKDQILSGKLKEGSSLPSIRSLAKDLRISVITTMKAYELLQEEGLITSVQGKGFYVNQRDSQMIQEQFQREIEENLLKAIKASQLAGISDEELKMTLNTLLVLKEEDDDNSN